MVDWTVESKVAQWDWKSVALSVDLLDLWAATMADRKAIQKVALTATWKVVNLVQMTAELWVANSVYLRAEM